MAATTAAVVGGLANAYSASKSGKGGGGGTPKWQLKAGQENYDYGKGVAERQSVAPMNADQLAAQQGVRDSQGYLAGDMEAAQGTASSLAGGVTADDIRGFYNPYENDVVNSYLDDLKQMRGTQDAAVSDRAQAARAFGGDREAVYRASIQGDLDRTGASTLSGIRSRGYELASSNALNNQGLRISGNDQLAQLIEARRRARYQDIGALSASGSQQQEFDQYSRDLDQRRLATRLNAAGTPQTSGPSNPQNRFAAGLAGFQDGVGAVRDLQGLWGTIRNPPPPAAPPSSSSRVT
jgi:hypothetical protein